VRAALPAHVLRLRRGGSRARLIRHIAKHERGAAREAHPRAGARNGGAGSAGGDTPAAVALAKLSAAALLNAHCCPI
jgi:hypothetical protein